MISKGNVLCMSKKSKELSEVQTNCSETIPLFSSYIDDPSEYNYMKAWKGFIDFVNLIEQVSSIDIIEIE